MPAARTNQAWYTKLHYQIFVMMGVAVAVGLPLNFLSENGILDRGAVLRIAGVGEGLGKLFLALLSMVVVPLIFSSLASSIVGLSRGGDTGSLGRMGLKVFVYYVTTSLLAIATGILLCNLIRPGDGLDYGDLMGRVKAAGHTAVAVSEDLADKPVLEVIGEVFFRMVPNNIFEAMRDNRAILAVVFFSLMLGVFTVKTGGEAARTLGKLFQAIFDVMMTMTSFIVRLAPIGIFGYLLFVTAGTGLELVEPLAWYMVTVVCGLAFHAFVTLPLILYLVARRNPLDYARAMASALATGFSTASSSGTLPLTMRCAEENAQIPRRVTSFVLPLGATVNMDGTALYEAAAVLFIAQMTTDLSLGQQIIVAVTALLASVGAAGIPHAGMVMMFVVLNAVGLPTEAVLTILAVDRVLDMCRTTVNIWSDSTGAAVIAHLEAGRDQPPDEAPPKAVRASSSP